MTSEDSKDGKEESEREKEIELYPDPDYDEVINTLRGMVDAKSFDRILNIIEEDLAFYLHAKNDIQGLDRLYEDLVNVAANVERLHRTMNHTIEAVRWRIKYMSKETEE